MESVRTSVDFYCPEHKVAIEVQGSVHADVLRTDYDAERREYLESQGIRVLCFENRELLESREHVLEMIKSAVRDRSSWTGGVAAR